MRSVKKTKLASKKNNARKVTAKKTATARALPVKQRTSGKRGTLLDDLRQLIDEAQKTATMAVNVSLTMLYWRVGKRIRTDVLANKRAGYGEQIVATVSRQLAGEYGDGFAEKNLRRMLQFSEAFPDEQIVATLWRQLSWSHFRELLPLKQPLQREFYAEMCRIEGWSVRTLSERIDSMLYERTAISKKPERLIAKELTALRTRGEVTPSLVLKDPYVIDFLGLKDRYLERDLEDAILRGLESFLLELGVGFSFVARQKRMQIDGEDFYLDLLFFNRQLRRLVAVELKLGRFKAADKAQMELYLRWLDKNERQAEEQAPLGIILCAQKNTEQVELLELGEKGIHVAEYLTVLPPKRVLHERLQSVIETARARYPSTSSK
jgi:Uncharacterized conserved protein